MSLPTVYIYPTEGLVSTFDGFEECTDVEACFLTNLRKFPQAERVQDAQVAFFPLTLGSKLHPHAGENVQYLWLRKYSKVLADLNVRRKVPHFLLCAYVLYKVNLSFVPEDCKILAYETEVTFGPDHSGDWGCGGRMITVPYILSQQSHPSAGILGPRPGDSVLEWTHFEARQKICYIGNAVRQGRSSSLVLDACSRRYGSKFVNVTPLGGSNVFATYSECKLAIVLRGDTPTRKAFYHAISYGAVPVVFRSTLLCYGELFAGTLPVQDMCLTIPDMPVEDLNRDAYLESVIAILESFLHDEEQQKTKQKVVRQYAPDLDYMCLTTDTAPSVSRPVLRAVEAVIGQKPRLWRPETPLVFYHNLPSEYNQTVFPVRISERETVHSRALKSQYSLEIHWDRAFRQRYLITTCFARASVAFVPIYSFLLGWKDQVFSNEKIAMKMNKLLEYMHEWHTRSSVPHVLVYSDVLWGNESSFLRLVHFPENTRLIALESCDIGPKVYVSPYVTEWNCLANDRVPKNGGRRSATLCYVGKASRTNGFKHPRFATHLIEQTGWRSINDEQLTLVCKNMFLSSWFSWQPHGDRRTRRSFYQSIFLGCIPVVTSTCISAYAECLGELKDCVVAVPDDMTLPSILTYVGSISNDVLHRLQDNARKALPKLQIDNWMDQTVSDIINENQRENA